MKIVVIGGTGILGSKVVDRLRDHGAEAVAASPELASTHLPEKASPRL
jgi:uncharacterized protein YbjT (DUF2867 family)